MATTSTLIIENLFSLKLLSMKLIAKRDYFSFAPVRKHSLGTQKINFCFKPSNNLITSRSNEITFTQNR